MTDTQPADGHEIRLTEKAAQVVLDAFRDENVDAQQSYLRVGAHPGGCSGYKFDMDYADASQVTEQDQVFTSHGVNIVVERTCLTDILGTIEIDFQTGNMVERGFKFRQMVNGSMCGCGESFAPIKQAQQQ